MKISLTNHRPEPSCDQAEKTFYKRLQQDYFFIRKIIKGNDNPGGVEPIIAARIEKIQFSMNSCKYTQAKLKALLSEYQSLFQLIQN